MNSKQDVVDSSDDDFTSTIAGKVPWMKKK